MAKPTHLPNTTLLTERGDLGELMVAGIQRYLLRATEQSLDKRQRHWCRDTSSSSAYVESVAANRQRLAKLIGAQDPRSAPELSYLT